MRTILAIDPGGCTGWCRIDWVEGSPLESKVTWGFLPESRSMAPHHLTLWGLLTETGSDAFMRNELFHLVWEGFNYQRRELDKGVSLVLDSKEYIGICKLYTAFNDLKGAEQQPSTMKLWDDSKIERLCTRHSMERPPVSPAHARDALRHALYHITVTMNDHSWIKFINDML